MAADPLAKVGWWRAEEGAIESGVPVVVLGAAWAGAWRVFAAPAGGRSITPVELAMVLGALGVVAGWALGRQLVVFGRRNPWAIALTAAGGALAFGAALSWGVGSSFASACAELAGAIERLESWASPAAPRLACRIGGVPGNPYIPGTLIHPNWDGTLSVPGWIGLSGMAMLGGLGLRERRLLPTRIARRLSESLALAPAAGARAVAGGLGPSGAVQACANPTLWGEVCGQVYPVERAFEPGEWCVRCQQPFRAAGRVLELNVVGLRTVDLDVLNGLERLDALSWPRGEPAPPDARVSGQERWALLGRVRVPDVLTVAQALALVHARLPEWGTQGPTAEAAALAAARASRVAAWLWFGRAADRLTYARPTAELRFAFGTARLRDLVAGSAEEITLQLELGLLPLELRTGFRQTFLADGRPAVLQNLKQDLWVPVGPLGEVAQPGVWVPRIEGAGLRAWLSLDRLRPAEARGVVSALPYRALDAAEPPAPRPGGLDLQRFALDPTRGEPVASAAPGASIADWDWFDGEHIELLRQQCLVLVNAGEDA